MPKSGHNGKSYPIKVKKEFLGSILDEVCVLAISFASSERGIPAGTAYETVSAHNQ